MVLAVFLINLINCFVINIYSIHGMRQNRRQLPISFLGSFKTIKQILEPSAEQYDNIHEHRKIRFDVDPEQELKPVEKFISTTLNVEDIRGSPGQRGKFMLTNLRIIWQLSVDNQVNISIGHETILQAKIKNLPNYGKYNLKHFLIVRAKKPSGKILEFNFMGYSPQALSTFNIYLQIQKAVQMSKEYRNINSNFLYENDEVSLLEEQEKISKYGKNLIWEDQQIFDCSIIVTNVRMIILKKESQSFDLAIPWIMISSIRMVEINDKSAIAFIFRGEFKNKMIRISCVRSKDTVKLEKQLRSFCEISTKNPILGYKFINTEKQSLENAITQEEQDFEQIAQTKINLIDRHKIYNMTSKQQGSLSQTEFNKEIGLLMQKLPPEVTRQDLWQIIK